MKIRHGFNSLFNPDSVISWQERIIHVFYFKQIFIMFLAGIFWLISGSALWAVPAAPGFHEFEQPDGTKFSACQKGDEFYHTMQTKEGYSVSHNKDSGWYEYRNLDANGKFVDTGLKVGKDDPAQHGIPRNLKEAAPVIKEKVSAQKASALNPNGQG